MKSVLIVDASTYKTEISEIYSSENYRVDTCETAFDAITKLKSNNYDLIVSQVMLPGDNAFELYYHINQNYPYLPIIMLTHHNIDDFFDEIMREGIGNVLSKPVNKEEILNLSEKLLTRKNIFGISNYIKNIIDHKKIRINSSRKIKEAISIILDHVDKWDFFIENRIMLNLVLNEIIINAVYHSHGYTQKKIDRMPVILNEGKYVDIHFAHNTDTLAVSIVDFNGTLTKKTILKSIYNVVNEKKIIENAIDSGKDISTLISETGRGIELVRQLASEFYFLIERSKKTEIILIFTKNQKESNKDSSSLKIIEIE